MRKIVTIGLVVLASYASAQTVQSQGRSRTLTKADKIYLKYISSESLTFQTAILTSFVQKNNETADQIIAILDKRDRDTMIAVKVKNDRVSTVAK